MEALLITIPISLILGAGFIWAFVWCVKSGQLDDLESNKNIVFNKSKGTKNGK